VNARHDRCLNTIFPLLLCAFLVFLLAACASGDDGRENGTQIALPLHLKRSSSAIAITPDGATLLVVNPDSNSLSLIDTASLNLIVELPVGWDPRTVSVDRSGKIAVTANRAGGTISVVDVDDQTVEAEIEVGYLPWGVVVTPDGHFAYAACEESDHIAVVDLTKYEVVGNIPVGDRPNGLALTADTPTLYVTHLFSGQVSVIDTAESKVTAVINTWPDANLSQSITLHPDGKLAYLPLTRSNTTNQALTFDTTVFPLVAVLDLEENQLLPRRIISLPEADTPVGLPFDTAFTPDATLLFVVNAASNDVSIIDTATNLAAAHLVVGDNPRGIVVAPDGLNAYVNNTLEGTVSVIDTTTLSVTSTVPTTDIPIPPTLLHGKRLFHSSQLPELSQERWMSCNTCHWEGEQDGRTWFFSFAGLRNTTSLLGMVNTYPLRWSAEWDESADSEFAITEEQFGAGLLGDDMHPPLSEPNQGRSYDLDCLAAFIDSLGFLPNPHRQEYDQTLVARGEEIFYQKEEGCVECHPPPYFTDLMVHDVGTADGPGEVLGPEIDTPTLLGLYRSAPFLHDGSATTLMQVLTTTNPNDEHGVTSHLLEALVAFMLAFP
jgi:YVTN family beta-propeller protein